MNPLYQKDVLNLILKKLPLTDLKSISTTCKYIFKYARVIMYNTYHLDATNFDYCGMCMECEHCESILQSVPLTKDDYDLFEWESRESKFKRIRYGCKYTECLHCLYKYHTCTIQGCCTICGWYDEDYENCLEILNKND